jgi:murein DD-endopeptidase MepM/ murein hydrolase activator NlpD
MKNSRTIARIALILSIINYPLSIISAQPADYYRSPLDIPVYLSANFGEIRTNRFHTGVDIKTEGVVGKPVFAAADGYIARVTVAPAGYGRALYIAHPNGTTTVYCHLDGFTPAIEEYLRGERYRLGRSDLYAFPDAARFPVKRGDRIGFAGNSGASGGPHLHFEVRESATSRTLNVPARGWLATAEADDVAPLIVRLYHIDVDTVAGVPVHSRPRAYDVEAGEGGI